MVKRSFPWFFQLERRQTSVLCAHEIASFVHLPIGIESISLHEHSNSSVNNNSKPNSIAIGFIKFRGKPIEKASIPLSDLSRHVYIIGATGTGKSSLLINIIAQAQQKGVCVHVIDPHGDMADELVECLGKEKLANVFYFDPIRVKFSINPFELPPYADSYEREMIIERIIGQMIELMKRIFGARYWGPALNRTFQNVLRLLYKKDDCPTYEDVLNFLLGRTEKFGVLAQNHEFQDLSQELQKIPKERIDAVINKVDPFVKNALLRMIFCNKQSTVDFKELLQPGKVVIWRLAKAELTEQNMQMIGSAIITKLWFHCASRPRDHRSPILLAIDEFQNFAHLETLQVMITEARKFGVSLILSHQHTKQLPESVLSEVLGNTATKIIFRVSGEDALILSKTLDISSARMLSSDLTNLPDGSAIVKLRAKFGEESVAPFEIFTLKPMERKPVDFNLLIAKMQEKFSAPHLIQALPRNEDEFSKLLEVVGLAGDYGVESLARLVGRSPSKVKEMLKKAEKMGLVELEQISTGGRPRIVISLTEKGKNALGKFLGREGGALHRFMLRKAVELLSEKGFRVKVPIQGGREGQPDLLAEYDGKEFAVEIETEASHPEQVKRNFEKNVKQGRNVIFVVPNQDVGRRIKNIIPEAEVFTLKVEEYMNERKQGKW
jgi:DNA-binding MarR family transcriptional regulator